MISLQLWTLRDLIAAEGLDEMLGRLAAAGFAHVEPFAVSRLVDQLGPALPAHGLTAPTAHGELTGDELGRTLDAAAAVGARIVMHPAFLVDWWHAPDGIARLAETLERAADAAAGYGMSVAFHHHDDDLSTVAPDGRPALIALMDLLPANAGVQFDPYWATVAGEDAVATRAALGDRILATQLKDGPIGGANLDQVALGDGEVDLVGVLDALPDEVPRVIAHDLITTDPWTAVLRGKAWLDRYEADRASRS